MKVYTIKDKLIGFTGPIAMKNEEVAKRWFESFCRDKKENEHIKTSDYELWEIGTYDDETGIIEGYKQSGHKLIAEGAIYDERKD